LRTDDGDLDGSLRDTELIQSPCRSERGPQPGEPGPENENAWGPWHRTIVTLER
jgi:hypothetical protein